MERGGHRQQHRALGALGFCNFERAFDRRLVAGDHHLPAAIVVGGLADLALGSLACDRHRRLIVETEQCRHGADADRHRLLHRKAAGAQQTRGIGDAQAAGRGQRRIFTERMAGHKGGIPADRETGFRFQHAQRRDRNRHQGGLGIFGQLEGFGRSLPNDRRQLFAERGVNLVEYRPRGRERIRQGLAHAHGLRTLARKGKCCGHFG